ncbi:substrate-binding domain-containing protein [Nocardiopsis aegyptia]|uniref:ABC-type phosphate transport system substrate-binding protein n=1 Tax=Nocardiopsis aegyptia TaxID=220378 RepID=A0A7Z0EIZ8_9ACTN|nr:substrate-binding domain-containing protein [Nocardiopsis aegyptia]NYJ32451.1 ABC-type phosphate transport system substrate-binding protein [Nocardiopsis aegyptia]
MAPPPRVPPGLSPLQPTDPREFPPFTVHGRLGAGGMGVVLAATDPAGAWVAIKVVRAEYAHDPEFRTRFASEIALMHRVRARCIAPVLAYDTDAGLPWYATAYLPGPTLRLRVRDGGRLPLEQTRVVAAGMAEAIAAIHAAGIVHRDLKPDNVILAPDGPKVLDFGIARAADETGLTRTGGLVGSPAWLSPERYRGVSGPEADVFAWGAMVAYAATGRVPFGSGGAETLMYRILNEEPDLEGLPEELSAPVTAALDKDPARRPRAAWLLHEIVGPDPAAERGTDDTTLVDGLIRAHWPGEQAQAPAPTLVAAQPNPAAPPTPPVPPGAVAARPPASGAPERLRRRAPLVVGAAGALSVALLGGLGGAYLLSQNGREEDPVTTTEPETVDVPSALAEEGALSGTLTGAGSTNVGEAVQLWSQLYTERQPGVSVSYDSVGSGAGVERFVQGDVDFGASERPLDAAEIVQAEQARDCPVVQFPAIAGAVAVVHANEDLEGLELSATDLERIYLGLAANYRDLAGDRMSADELPDLAVVPVRHDDQASTARVFSRFLSERGESWQMSEDGTGSEWGDVAVPAVGDEGVVQTILQEPGAIGFVNAAYVEENDLTAVAVVNDHDNAVEPGADAVREATEQLELASDGSARLSAVGGDAYPIMRINHVFAFECGYDGGDGAALRDFWLHALGEDAAEVVEDAGYAPLAPSISEEVAAIVSRIDSL